MKRLALILIVLAGSTLTGSNSCRPVRGLRC